MQGKHSKKNMAYFCIKTAAGDTWDVWKSSEADLEFTDEFCKKFKFTFTVVGKKTWTAWKNNANYKRTYTKEATTGNNTDHYLETVYHVQIGKNTTFLDDFLI